MAFKDGEEVLIQNPGPLIGTIIHVRPADKNLPEDQKLYSVQINEKRYYRSASLEPADQPTDRLEVWGKEWLEELNRTARLCERLQADKGNLELMKQLVESGSKLGFFVPIEDAGKKPK